MANGITPLKENEKYDRLFVRSYLALFFETKRKKNALISPIFNFFYDVILPRPSGLASLEHDSIIPVFDKCPHRHPGSINEVGFHC